MKFNDLRFIKKDYDVLNTQSMPKVYKVSVFDEWPSFPGDLLEGKTIEEIINQSVEALIEVFGSNCLTAEYSNGVIIVHCGDIDSEVQNEFYDFTLV